MERLYLRRIKKHYSSLLTFFIEKYNNNLFKNSKTIIIDGEEHTITLESYKSAFANIINKFPFVIIRQEVENQKSVLKLESEVTNLKSEISKIKKEKEAINQELGETLRTLNQQTKSEATYHKLVKEKNNEIAELKEEIKTLKRVDP